MRLERWRTVMRAVRQSDQWEKLGTELVSAMDAVANNPAPGTPATVASSASALAVAYNKQLGQRKWRT